MTQMGRGSGGCVTLDENSWQGRLIQYDTNRRDVPLFGSRPVWVGIWSGSVRRSPGICRRGPRVSFGKAHEDVPCSGGYVSACDLLGDSGTNCVTEVGWRGEPGLTTWRRYQDGGHGNGPRITTERP